METERPRSGEPDSDSAAASADPEAEIESGDAAVESARRIVVKVGSSLVTNEGRGLDADAISRWGRQIAELRALGKEVILVSSGAVAEGMKRLGWTTRPHELPELQAAAAVGQMGLAQMYESQLAVHGLVSAQVLLTHADLADRERYLNARSTLLALVSMRSASANGTPLFAKNVMFCTAPSSTTTKSCWLRFETCRWPPSVTVTVKETRSTPARGSRPRSSRAGTRPRRTREARSAAAKACPSASARPRCTTPAGSASR